MKRKFFTLFLALAAGVGTMFADGTKIGDLYYNLNETDKTAEVTYEFGWWDGDNYQGLTTANIPASVTYSGTTYSVTSIGYCAFYGCSSLTSVTIPNSVTSIGNYAFEGCSNLTSVTIPNSVTSIGSNAFSYCSSLTSIEIPNSVTSIGEDAFEGCSNLTSVTIPNSVTSIGYGAFAYCSSLTSVTIPNSVTSIGNGAFYGCSSLTSVTIPNSVTNIGEGAFDGCSGLTSVVWNAKNCSNSGGFDSQVESFVFGNEVETIPASCCFGMNKLSSIEIPNSVTSIGYNAFSGCSSLPVIDNLRYADTYLVEAVDRTRSTYTIKDGTRWIGEEAFYGCSSLTSVTIPNSVTSIGNSAFSGCSGLTSVTIPNSVTSIGDAAFAGCSGLTSVTCKANTPPVIGDDVFAYYSSCEICVPYSALDAYKNTWSEYAYRISREKVLIGDLYYYLEALDHTAIVTYYGKYYGGQFKILSYDIDSVVIPQTVTYQMEEYAVVRIGDDAFRAYDYDRGEGAGNNVRSITLHSGITSIAPSAFCKDEDRLCSSVILSSIYVPCGELERFQQMVSDDRLKYIPSSYHITINKSTNGYVSVPNFTSCDKEVQISANPDYGYHFVKWNDGNTDNPRRFELTQDTTFEAIFAHNPVITYKYDSNLGYVDGPITTPTGMAEDDITFTAQPARGCNFVKWGDGNTDNPRTYHLSQDVTMEAIFDYALSGSCGKDNVLTWKLDKSAMALEISCAGALADNFNYTYDIVSATIGNEVTFIGQNAFAYCSKLKNVIVGSNVKVIEEYAFYDCTAIETITCYSMRPPTVNNGAFENLDYSTIVYVPADYLNTYKMHDFWGVYDVRPIGANKTETTEVKVEPTATTADVVWPAVENAATYELVIKDKSGNVVCTLIFNANGQLTQIAFGAPARNNAAQAAGFAFTVTGLEEGTSYDLTITAKDGNGTTLDEKTIAFTTSSETGVDALQAGELHSSKIMRDGQVLIMRGGKMYNLQGVEVK